MSDDARTREDLLAEIETLRSRLRRAESLFATMTLGVAYQGADGAITSANPAAERILGLSLDQMQGRTSVDPRWRSVREDGSDLPGDEHPSMVALRTGRPVSGAVMGVYHPERDETRWLRVDAVPQFRPGATAPFEVYAVFEDITDARRKEEERRDLEAQLRRAQKLETIGTLAGGIAHDFNNILAPIVGYTDMAVLSLREDDPVRADLVHVKNAADRARELVQQILLFSRRAEQDRVPVELPGVIDEALKLLRPSLPSTVTITRDIDRSCGRVLADATQLHQVVVNLCTNAWQVMEEEGGTLGISLREIDVEAGQGRGRAPLAPGRYACLAVRDSGPGVDAAYIDRIFEPFFTTKGPDGGTGLGLSVVHGIVRGHGGEVQVASEEGKGAEFRVLLPLASGPTAASQPENGDAEPGSGRILVVDDEKDVAQLVCKMLRHFGYNAQYCTSGTEALSVLDDMGEDCDLMISDLTMPDLTGVQLAEQSRALRPGLPIVLMTGFGRDLTAEEKERCGDCRVIAKPVTARTLTGVVKAALSG
jgi:two-component system cell cycle sensor histidine kinase/response regulator CckA